MITSAQAEQPAQEKVIPIVDVAEIVARRLRRDPGSSDSGS